MIGYDLFIQLNLRQFSAFSSSLNHLMKIPFFLSFLLSATLALAAPIRVLLIDGRNNHNWETTTDALRATLEATQMFEVTVTTAPESTSSPGLRAPRNADAAKQEKFSKAAQIHRLLNLPAKKPMAKPGIRGCRNSQSTIVWSSTTMETPGQSQCRRLL